MNKRKTDFFDIRKPISFLFRNNTLPVFIGSFLCRTVTSIIQFQFNTPELTYLAVLNSCLALFEFILILSYSRLNRLLSFTLFTLDLVFFCVAETIIIQMVCGMEFCIIACIPATILLTSSYNASKKYYFSMYAVFFLSLAFISWYKLRVLPPVRLYLPERRDFFIMSQFFWTLTVLAYLLYICFLTYTSLSRMEKKRKFRLGQLDYISKHDPLTGLMNRRRIHLIFNECDKLKTINNIDYALCIFDIDDFKKINDTYGHPAGDWCLTKYTKAVWDRYKDPVKIGRWGGEEFVIVFPNITENTIFELEKIRKEIAEQPIFYNGKSIKVTATYGISSSRKLSSPEEILSDADSMLLEGKQHGKNRLVVSENF